MYQCQCTPVLLAADISGHSFFLFVSSLSVIFRNSQFLKFELWQKTGDFFDSIWILRFKEIEGEEDLFPARCRSTCGRFGRWPSGGSSRPSRRRSSDATPTPAAAFMTTWSTARRRAQTGRWQTSSGSWQTSARSHTRFSVGYYRALLLRLLFR